MNIAYLLSVRTSIRKSTPGAFFTAGVFGARKFGSKSNRFSFLVHHGTIVVHDKFHTKQLKWSGLLGIEYVNRENRIPCLEPIKLIGLHFAGSSDVVRSR